MKITIIGTGYVGLVTGVGLAELGHTVYCVDTIKEKIDFLQKGQAPFYEPDLEKLLKKNIKSKRLMFSVSLAEVINKTDFLFICVGTPPQANGSADLSYVYAVAEQIKDLANNSKIVVVKSTVPVGTNAKVESILAKNIRQRPTRLWREKAKFSVVSCPEFLREGRAIYDFFHSDRLVVGSTNEKSAKAVADLFGKVKAQKVITTRETAELIKYASNAFLATKISFINEIANLCDKVKADVTEVALGMGLDKRINPYFLKAGIGYGGSCFPKDVKALRQISGGNGYDFKLLKAVIEVNGKQRKIFMEKIKKVLGNLNNKKIGLLGLAFKDNTDDIRESAAIDLAKYLVKAGAMVTAYDAKATLNAKKVLGNKINFVASAYEAVKNVDAIIIATEWPEFIKLDWLQIKKLMKQPIIFDGKNLLDPEQMKKNKFNYYSVGR